MNREISSTSTRDFQVECRHFVILCGTLSLTFWFVRRKYSAAPRRIEQTRKKRETFDFIRCTQRVTVTVKMAVHANMVIALSHVLKCAGFDIRVTVGSVESAAAGTGQVWSGWGGTGHFLFAKTPSHSAPRSPACPPVAPSHRVCGPRPLRSASASVCYPSELGRPWRSSPRVSGTER